MELPETVSSLSDLQKLWLTQNALRTLPVTFSGLRQLTCLWLNGNQMKDLPLPVHSISLPLSLFLKHPMKAI